jgi:hypothetical protein
LGHVEKTGEVLTGRASRHNLENVELRAERIAMTAVHRQLALALLALVAITDAAADLPGGWQPVKLSDDKIPTDYRIVTEGGTPVLAADAKASASALGQRANFDIGEYPVVNWRWKTSGLIDGADNSVAAAEDSPVRLIFAFDGDKSKLAPRDHVAFRLSKQFSGRELPYATLMYVWSNTAPVGTVIESPRTRRVQMVVASSGAGAVGAWQTLSRNVVEDFQRAFKEKPGKLLAFGVMSDTDNTGAHVQAWYGEIEFRKRDGPVGPHFAWQ